MAKKTDMEKRLEAKAKMIPKEGFNLVGFDDFEEPGDELHLAARFDTHEEADAAMKKRMKDDPSQRFFIYGPDDH